LSNACSTNQSTKNIERNRSRIKLPRSLEILESWFKHLRFTKEAESTSGALDEKNIEIRYKLGVYSYDFEWAYPKAHGGENADYCGRRGGVGAADLGGTAFTASGGDRHLANTITTVLKRDETCLLAPDCSSFHQNVQYNHQTPTLIIM
jgi:hypothetical protein